MNPNMKPTVGMKVHAVIVGSDGDIVRGTITNVEQFPTITLDDGKIVNGMECWWSPVDEKIQSEEGQ